MQMNTWNYCLVSGDCVQSINAIIKSLQLDKYVERQHESIHVQR